MKMMEINCKIRTDLGNAWYNPRLKRYVIKYRGVIMPLHKAVYLKANGKIPKGYEIHHVDGNKFNNHVSNLVALPREEHKKMHSGCGHQYDLNITHLNPRKIPKEKLLR